jgi:hypothetical protein
MEGSNGAADAHMNDAAPASAHTSQQSAAVSDANAAAAAAGGQGLISTPLPAAPRLTLALISSGMDCALLCVCV